MADIYSLKTVRDNVKKLYEANPEIHVNVTLTQPKICLQNVLVKITGVYAHIFQIEDNTGVRPKKYTVQYTDVLLDRVEIIELKSLSVIK